VWQNHKLLSKQPYPIFGFKGLKTVSGLENCIQFYTRYNTWVRDIHTTINVVE